MGDCDHHRRSRRRSRSRFPRPPPKQPCTFLLHPSAFYHPNRPSRSLLAGGGAAKADGGPPPPTTERWWWKARRCCQREAIVEEGNMHILASLPPFLQSRGCDGHGPMDRGGRSVVALLPPRPQSVGLQQQRGQQGAKATTVRKTKGGGDGGGDKVDFSPFFVYTFSPLLSTSTSSDPETESEEGGRKRLWRDVLERGGVFVHRYFVRDLLLGRTGIIILQ